MKLQADVVKQLKDWLIERYKSTSHRQFLILAGKQTFTQEIAETAVSHMNSNESVLWLGSRDSGLIASPVDQYTNQLGREYSAVVYDALQSLNINAILAMAGTVKQNGLFILLCPALANWHLQCVALQAQSYGFQSKSSRFIQYFRDHLLAHTTTAWVEEHDNSINLQLPIAQVDDVALCHVQHQYSSVLPGDSHTLTTQQHEITQQLFKIVDEQQSFAISLTAKRGRGKSWLLGYLCQHWLQLGFSVTLVAPQSDAVQRIFEHTDKVTNNTRFRYVAPDHDALLSPSDNADIVVIDEAAAIPIPQIVNIIQVNKRCILSTTVEGYEGTGKGFTQKLEPLFSSLQRLHVAFTLEQPLRWLHNDPIEALCASLFERLDCKTISPPESNTDHSSISCCFKTILSSTDTQSVNLLKDAFQLLKLAHYQTTPNDFVRMLDAADSQVLVAMQQERIVGAVLLTYEGGKNLTEVNTLIAAGRRRVQGHLSTQLLAYNSAIPEIATLTTLRISRIAVDPALQGLGIGTQLVDYSRQMAQRNKIDLITTVFGKTDRLNHFWQQLGYQQFRLSGKANKASGLVNTLFYDALTAKAKEVMNSVAKPTIEQRKKKLTQFIDGSRNWLSIRGDLAVVLQTIKDPNSNTELLQYLITHQQLTETQLVKNIGLANKAALHAKVREDLIGVLHKKTPH